MPYYLGKNSQKELVGVHEPLPSIVVRALELTLVDFAVHDGIRTLAEQREYVRTGVSHTMQSKHLQGKAVDLVPYINGKLRWEWEPIYEVAVAMHRAACEFEHKLRWGGVWDRIFNDLEGTKPELLRREVEAYVDRRKKLGKEIFLDGPHYEDAS
jgi:peptidoglycan L-alanyl-D-glutamate endopeptidase CwlK